MAEFVHPFYGMFRIVFLAASATIALAFAFQNYVDRRSVRKLIFESPRTFTTYRVFRIGVLCGALLHTVVGIDVFGAHGIYAPYTRVTLIGLSSIWIGVVFPISIVNELSVAFQLKTFGSRTQKFVKYAGASAVPWAIFMLFTMKYINSRTYYIFGRVMISCAIFVFWCVQVYVYLTLQRHHQAMQNKNMTTSVSKDFWQDLIKQWRKYTILCSMLLVVTIGNYTYEGLNPITSGITRDNVNFSVDYSTAPTFGQINRSVFAIFVMMVLGWRAWLGKEQRAHLADELSNERSERNASATSVDVEAAGRKEVVCTKGVVGTKDVVGTKEVVGRKDVAGTKASVHIDGN